MTINAHIDAYPKGTKSVLLGKGEIEAPVVRSLTLKEPGDEHPLYFDSKIMTLTDVAKGTFFQCYNEEFSDIDAQTRTHIKWNKQGKNRICEHYHISEGVKCSQFNRKPYVPYDNNRITIDGEYLNASPVVVSRNAFIVMQSPLPVAFFRFWEMVWRKKVNTILLITNIGNHNTSSLQANEFHRYWPQSLGDRVTFGRICLRHLDSLTTEIGKSSFGKAISLHESTFSIKVKKCRRRHVKLFQYNQWEENRAPELLSFMNLTVRVQHYASNATGPLVVQSSGGAGRAGTFVAAFTLVSDIWKRIVNVENPDDVAIFVKDRVLKLREQRFGMVLTAEQYLFIYKVAKKLVDMISNQKRVGDPDRDSKFGIGAR